MADNANVLTANHEAFGMGDGDRAVFPITYGGSPYIRVVEVDAIYIKSWEGDQKLSNAVRTQYCTNTEDFSKWGPINTKGDLNQDMTLQNPDGSDGVWNFSVGSLVGAWGSVGGVVETNVSQYVESPQYVSAIWLKADRPAVVSLLFNSLDTSDSTKQIIVTTDWTLHYLPQQLSLVPAGTGVGIAVDRMAPLNSQMLDTEKVYFAFPQMEISNNGTPTSYMVNNGDAAKTVPAQYMIQAQSVVFPLSELPQPDEVLYWDGRLILDSATPFGPNLTVDIMSGVTWRYDQAKNLISLLTQKQRWLSTNQAQFWNSWFTQTFNLKTASTFGVSVWAYILAVPLSALSLREGFRYWGFGPMRENFNTTGQMPENPTSGNFPPVNEGGGTGIISPREKVQALRLRYYELTGPATISAINHMLRDVFLEDGIAYIQDNEDMTATYVFNFPLSSFFKQAMLQYGLLPKPAGVKLYIQST